MIKLLAIMISALRNVSKRLKQNVNKKLSKAMENFFPIRMENATCTKVVTRQGKPIIRVILMSINGHRHMLALILESASEIKMILIYKLIHSQIVESL